MVVYINKKEKEAIYFAEDYVRNLLESCTADYETREGKRALKDLNDTINGLMSIQNKF